MYIKWVFQLLFLTSFFSQIIESNRLLSSWITLKQKRDFEKVSLVQLVFCHVLTRYWLSWLPCLVLFLMCLCKLSTVILLLLKGIICTYGRYYLTSVKICFIEVKFFYSNGSQLREFCPPRTFCSVWIHFWLSQSGNATRG